MDEKQLKDMLSTLKAPAQNDDRRAAGIAAAMAAFDKNIVDGTQGDDDIERLTGRKTTTARSSLMQSSRKISGLTGAVALCALVAVLGVPFFTHQMDSILGGKEIKSRISQSSGVLDPPVIEKTDEATLKAVMRENERRAAGAIPSGTKQSEEAAQRGGSAMPIPIGKPMDDALTPPPAAVPHQKGDPLQEWRSKSEAKRQSLDSVAEAPEEQVAQQKNALEGADRDLGKVVTKQDGARRNAQAPMSEMDRMEPRKEAEKKSKDKEAYYYSDEKAARARGDRMIANKPMATSPSGSGGAMPMDSSAEMAAPSLRVRPEPEPVVVIAPKPVERWHQPVYQEQGRESFPDFADNPVKATSAEPVSTFSIDVDTASYSFIRRSLNAGQMPPKGAVRLEELINYFPYDYELPGKGEDPFRPTVAVYKCPWKEDHKIVHIGLKGYDLTDKPKTNMVFLIDTSGSMNAPDRLPLAISSLKLALESLKADDTVGIVTYAGSSGVVLEPTKVAEKQKIMDALDRLSSGGSTAGQAGIQSAYGLAAQAFVKEGNNRVILATDGDFNVGISNPNELKNFIAQKRSEGIFLSVLGFGRGNYQDATMQALAQNGNGNAAYIDNLSEARKVLVQEAGATMFTIAKDVKIQVEFNPALVQEYRLLGYETRHLNREDFNNDKIDAGEIGAGHTVTAIYEITPVGATPVADNLRYGAKEIALAKIEDKSEFSNELAFLKMRYKRPDSDTSVLMTRPISTADEKEFSELPDDIRFAASVAGFGQLLRESQYTASLNWQQVIDMAQGAKGKDEFGYRAEFINLLRLAKSQSGQK